MGVRNASLAGAVIVAAVAVMAPVQLASAQENVHAAGVADAESASDTTGARAPLPRSRPRTFQLPGAAPTQLTSSRPFGPATPATSSAFPYFAAASPASQQPLATVPSRLATTGIGIPGIAQAEPGVAAVAAAAAELNHPGVAAIAAFPLPKRARASYSTAGVPFPPSVIAAAAMSARAEADANLANTAAADAGAPRVTAAPTATSLADAPQSAPPTQVATDLVVRASATTASDSGPRAPQSAGQQLRISNKTNVKIATLSIVPAKGRVRTTRIAENLLPFKSTNAPLPSGQGCDFTIHGTFEDGSPIEAGDTDLCRDPTINITLF